MIKVLHGDCKEVLAGIDSASIDTVITDPPYGIHFKGQAWDRRVPGAPLWAEVLRVARPGASLLAFGGTRTWHHLAYALEDAGWQIRDTLMWLYGQGLPKNHDVGRAVVSMAEMNGDAVGARWAGWGTALKPAWEPIILAMKPVRGSFAANALAEGVAGLWIEGGRTDSGRWPTDLLLDDEAAAMIDAQSRRTAGTEASRFFYVAKAGRKERDAGCEGLDRVPVGLMSRRRSRSGERHSAMGRNVHPTVKPLALMRYLVRLTATPTGGVVLDPFMGSGTTGCACALEGRSFVGIERKGEYVEIARRRIDYWRGQHDATGRATPN